MTSPEKNSPNSWPALVWKFCEPRRLIIIISLVLVVYVALRISGHDVLPPILSKIGISPVAASMDISGKWKYKCTVIGTPFLEWGGAATIRQESTPYGIQWKLYGQRFWKTTVDESGNKHTENLLTPFPWETIWGVITPEPAMRFAYIIDIGNVKVEGYAYGDIQESNGRPNRIIGKFYHLPPSLPLHGRMEMRRINDGDAEWD